VITLLIIESSVFSTQKALKSVIWFLFLLNVFE
jgi:hypothetical protein